LKTLKKARLLYEIKIIIGVQQNGSTFPFFQVFHESRFVRQPEQEAGHIYNHLQEKLSK
jgi:hypothetical protein